MSKDGDNDLFADMEFIIPDSEITDSEQSGQEEQLSSGSEEKTETTETAPKEEQLIEFDEPLSTDDGDSTSSITEGNSDGASSSSPLSSVVTALSAEGFINVTEEELENLEDPAQFLRDKLNASIDEKIKTSLTPKQLEAFEAYEKGVPIEQYVNSNAREQSYQNVTNDMIESREDVQAELVRRSLIQKGFSEEDAADTVNTYKEVGGDKLKSKAIAARDELVRYEQAYRQQLEEQAEAQRQQFEEARQKGLEDTKEYVNSQSEIIEGIPLTDKVKEELYTAMTTPVGETKDGSPINIVGQTRMKDPKRFDMLMTYYHQLGLFEEVPDFSKIKKVAETKAAKGLDTLLQEGTSFMKSSGTKSKGKSDTEGDLGLDFI